MTTRPAAYEREILAAASDLTANELRALERAVDGLSAAPGGPSGDLEVHWFAGHGVKVLLVICLDMVPMPEEVNLCLRGGRFERLRRDEVLGLAECSATALERVWRATTHTPVMTRARLTEQLAVGNAPADAEARWREPWEDTEGAHLLADIGERCVEVVHRRDGRVESRTAWEHPRLRTNPEEFWME